MIAMRIQVFFLITTQFNYSLTGDAGATRGSLPKCGWFDSNSRSLFFLFFFLTHIFIITILFWALAFLNNFFFKKRKNKDQKMLYECGFRSLSQVNLDLNINFFISACLVLLYELEFLFLIPLLFNFNYFSIQSLFYILIIFFFFFLSFYLDVKLNLTKWSF